MCYIAVKYNQKDFLKTYLLMTLFGFIPTWALTAYFSKNLLFDAVLYDLVLVLTTTPIMIFLGQAYGFTFVNWAGLACCVTGLVLLKL